MSRSPGASLRLAALLLAATAATGDETGEQSGGYATAEQAVAARAWEDAARIWRSEAEAGRPEAYLGLGNLWDLGVLGRRDEAAALDYYRRAAIAGLPVAAFNVGAMHAAGSGTARDMASAAHWYARAALGGHDRAAFAMGRLHASGDTLPRNATLAAGWLEEAARTIPAAVDALAGLDTDRPGGLTAPEPLAFQFREEDGKRWAEAAWSAMPGPVGSWFRVEIMERRENGQPGTVIAGAEARAGAIRLAIPADVEGVDWRVVMIDPVAGDYVASHWHDDAAQALPVQTSGMVSFWTGVGNARASAAANSVAGPLRGAGLRVTHRIMPEAPTASAVRYRYAADAPLARDIALFLPALGASDVSLDPTLDAQPGEVIVVLAFD